MKKFGDWKASMGILGITYQDIMQILIACILLGNVEFEDQGDYNVQICSSKDDLSKLCELLGLSVTSLVEGLTMGTSHYRGETIQCPLDIRQVKSFPTEFYVKIIKQRSRSSVGINDS